MDILGYVLGGSLVLWVVWKWVIVPLLDSDSPVDSSAYAISNEGRQELTRLRVAVIGTPSYGDLMDESYYVPDWATLKAMCDEYDVSFEISDIQSLQGTLEQAIIDRHRTNVAAEAAVPAT